MDNRTALLATADAIAILTRVIKQIDPELLQMDISQDGEWMGSVQNRLDGICGVLRYEATHE